MSTPSNTATNHNTTTNQRPRRFPHFSVAAERALTRARIHHHTTATTTVIATLTLLQQTHRDILGAAGRATLLDAHQATQKMRNHTWPALLKRALEGINRRARDALEKRLRLAVRSAVVTAALDATGALAAHVDRTVDFTNRHSVQANADLVRDCLNEISDDADRNLGTPVPWRECLPAAILDAHDAPALLLVTYLADWARTDAADEANVRAALAAEAQM